MLTQSREHKLVRAALDSRDYRGFLANALVASSKEGDKPNIAALSRKAGFSSRSFIGDVIDGRRRLSARSYPKLARALALPIRLKSYFHLLVIRDERELNFENLRPDQIEAKILDVRAKLNSQLAKEESEREAATVLFKGRDLLDCYAALGPSGRGAAVTEVSKKTGLPADACTHALRFLVARGVVTENDGRFHATNSLFFVKDLGEDKGLKSCYLQSLDELKRKANIGFNSKDNAFFQFIYSLDRSRLPELKQRLWELLQEFVETSENSEGDGIGKLVIGLYA